MFNKKEWIIVCLECKIKRSLGNDTIKNLFDIRGQVIASCYDTLCDLIKYYSEFNLSIDLLNTVKAYIDEHKGHTTHIVPLIDDEFDDFKDTTARHELKNTNLLTGCHSCKQSVVFSCDIPSEKGIGKISMTIQKLESFNQLFELYNEIGCLVDNNKMMIAFESIFPFYKRHAGHDLWLKSENTLFKKWP